jgi:hypothetical protein
MKSLKTFITEEKNTHMEHMEDLVFNEGVDGTRKAINFLRDLRDMLAGHSDSKLTATVKWDGAPAIFAGIDPRDGKFFVAKKSVFNKVPQIYKTEEDIHLELSGPLADKFSVALKEFSKLGIKKGVYQGDLMFTKGDVKLEEIEGENYYTFHPNTIVYAVPVRSDLGDKIKNAKIGVVWHTTYTGNSFETMNASFGKGIVEHLNQVPSIWMDDATYKDYAGTATFTKEETKQVTELLSKAGTLFKSLNANIINAFRNDDYLLTSVKSFNNLKVKNGQKITNTKNHVDELFHYIYDKIQKEIDSRKTIKGKEGLEEKRKKVLSIFSNHDKDDIVKIFDLTNLLVEAKHMIINKMNQASHISTFLKTSNGFKVTGVEGFVAIDHLTGGAVKIINRMEFSKANFSPEIIKGWERH